MTAMKVKLEQALPIAVAVLALIAVLLYVYSINVPEPTFDCWDGSTVTDSSLCPTNPWSWEGANEFIGGIFNSVGETICSPYQVFGLVIDLC